MHAVRPVGCPHSWLYDEKKQNCGFWGGNEEDSFLTHFWVHIFWGQFCYKNGGKRPFLAKMWARDRTSLTPYNNHMVPLFRLMVSKFRLLARFPHYAWPPDSQAQTKSLISYHENPRRLAADWPGKLKNLPPPPPREQEKKIFRGKTLAPSNPTVDTEMLEKLATKRFSGLPTLSFLSLVFLVPWCFCFLGFFL